MHPRPESPGGPAFSLVIATMYWGPLWLIDLVYPYPLRQTLANPVLLALCGLAAAVVLACAAALAALAWLVARRWADSAERDALAGSLVAAASGAALLLRRPLHDAFGNLGLTSATGLVAIIGLGGIAGVVATWAVRCAAGRRPASVAVWWVVATVAWAVVVAWQLRLSLGEPRAWVALPPAVAALGLATLRLAGPVARWRAALVLALVAGFGVPVGVALSRPQAAGNGAGGVAVAAATGPNVVLVVIDTVRADHVSMTGYARDTTPSLAHLAADGATVFTHAVPAATATIPSVKGLFTSRSPSRGGLRLAAVPPAAGEWTLARAFAAAGYATAGFSANGVIEGGFAQGFESFVSGCGYSYLFRSFTLRSLLSGDRVWEMYGLLDRLGLYKTRGETVLRLADRWLDRHAGTRPYFLYLHLLEPHWPYRDCGMGFVDDALRSVEPRFSFVELLQLPRGDPANEALRRTPQLREMVARHDDSLRRADALLGELLDRLAGSGELASSLVIVVGDHGEEFFEHASYGHGFDVFEEQAHVPWVIHWPTSLAAWGWPARVDQPVSLSDLLPTLTELLTLPAPPIPFEGRSLLPLLAGEPGAAVSPVACESYPIGGCIASYRDGTRKVRLRFDRRQSPRTIVALQVFDLATDPAEQRPLALDDPEVAALAARARQHFEGVWRSWREPDNGVTAPGESGDEALDRLRAIGYLD